MEIVYETNYLTVQHDTANDCLFLTWRGKHPASLIKATSEVILQQVGMTRSNCLLNDATQDLDGWREFISWFGHTLYPELTGAGIRAIAWVLPHNLAALADTKNLLTLVEHAHTYRSNCPAINTFADVESAYSWLQQTTFLR